MHFSRMILFMLVLLGSVPISSSEEDSNPFFQFRKKTLNNLNEARRLLASGDIRKLYDLIGKLIPEKEFNGNVLGPASNMYQLKWDRQLEQIAFEYMYDKSVKRSTNILKSIEYKDHVGFYWMGNIFNLLSGLFGGKLSIPNLKPLLDGFIDILEAIIMFLWLAAAAPTTLPIPEGQHYGPAEALFGERYEIGCFTEIAYSVCFMKQLPYRENMFKNGVPCTSCSTHCEFSKTMDGTIDEGELCVPPKEPSVNYVAANVSLTGSSYNYSPTVAMVVVSMILPVFFGF